jgi:hypothetical protein
MSKRTPTTTRNDGPQIGRDYNSVMDHTGVAPHLDPSMSARGHIHRIAAEHGLTYQNDGIAHLARQIENMFGNAVDSDETSNLVIAIRRAGVMDGQDLTRLHGRYLRERAAEAS